MIQDTDFAKQLYDSYQNYRENDLSKKRFKHSDILLLIERLKDKNIFSVNKAGNSVCGRSINLIKFGEGKTNVFLWSQMHGDESTATMAIFDILNFLSSDDNFNSCRNRLKKKLTIYFLPMVNPDGAELFQRENILNIDINRDASRFQTVEAKILLETFNNVKAQFGFNLHDQDRTYSAGRTHKPATISFLAPAFNFEKEINDVRSDAMKIIGKLDEILSLFIPGHIAKYNDDFEPRAFGDNFQKLGMSTILIESGGWDNDLDKQFARRLNFIALLAAFKSIAEESYKGIPLNAYEKIPENEKNLLDLIIRNVSCEQNGNKLITDVGINRTEINFPKSRKFYYESKIEEVGDLSNLYGYEEYDFEGLSIHPGKIFNKGFRSIDEIKKINFVSLFKKGYTYVKLKSGKLNSHQNKLPINIILNGSGLIKNRIKSGDNPNFYFEKNGKVMYTVINGFLYDITANTGEIRNGLVFK